LGFIKREADAAMKVSEHEVTGLLVAWSEGDKKALDRLAPLVYDELRHIAHRHMKREAAGHTLQTTALVNEAYLKLAGQRTADWESRRHFFGVAAHLRQIEGQLTGSLTERVFDRQAAVLAAQIDPVPVTHVFFKRVW